MKTTTNKNFRNSFIIIYQMIYNDFIFICGVMLVATMNVCMSMGNPKLIVMKTGLEDVTQSSVALQFFVNVNNTGKHDLEVSLIPDQCCVDVGNKKLDCNVVEAIGSCYDIVPSGESKYLRLVAPLLDPYNRRGYCDAYVDSKIIGRRHVMRDAVKIPIDTRVKVLEMERSKIPNVQRCGKIDQDPLNRCQPVNCLRYYNGRKSYFNKLSQKCMIVPPCIANKCDEMPDTIYDPVKNECINENPVSREDIAFVKALIHGGRTPKDIVIIKNFKNPDNAPNVTKDSTYTDTTIEKIKSVPSSIPLILPEKPTKQCKADSCVRQAVFEYFTKNRWAFTCLILVIILQCSLLCAMVYFFSETCCCKRKKLIRKYFNYRQDASVTTPLIGTSNIETETTDYQYYSESSNNVENKIKSYKACQKEIDNVKMSLSDDILSKCLNRRDWQHNTAKSEAIHDCNNKVCKAQEIVAPTKKSKSSEDNIVDSKAINESKLYKSDIQITYENENFKRYDAKRSKVRSIVKKLENKPSTGRKSIRTSLNDSDIVYSEQEIKCHSYNFMDDGSLRQHSSCSLTSPTKNKNLNFVETVKKPPSSLSTEKSAQACFTNDSIDDLLSERGMLLLAGENISKYSFSTTSNSKSISSVSSKTSKNNIVKNVLSLLHRKPKTGPVSDPGGKKSKESMDLEIIHMSHGTVYSSANESDVKVNKEYKTKKGKNRTSR